MSEANRDAAMECLGKARTARADGDFAKAKRFGDKAKALYPCAEVDSFLRSVQGGTSSSYQAPSGPSTRQRATAGASTATSNGKADAPAATASTPAQREMVARIRAAKGDFYKTLGVPRDASDADIKKAYKKLALKVHPDRCSAPGSEEAFKEVSKAFQCLTDAQKRAYYDRTGHEDRASATAAATSRGGGGGYGPNYQELDPEQLFNMMFGGGGLRGFGMGPMHFGGFPQGHPRRGAQQRQQGQPQAEETPNLAGLLPMLIAVAILLVTLLAQQYSPSASIARSSAHPDELFTQQRSVPFYVKDGQQFERSFPARSPNRWRLERQMEAEYQNELLQRCRAEFARENRKRTSVNFRGKGNKAQFESSPKPNCDRLYTMFGTNAAHHGW